MAAVDSLAAILAKQRHVEDTIGSAELLEPVAAQLTVVNGLVLEARGTVRHRMLDVGAQWAQFAGWLAVDTDRKTQAGQEVEQPLGVVEGHLEPRWPR